MLRQWFPSDVQKRADLKELERKSNFYSLFINKGDTCFDVGANMGNRIAPLLSIGAKIVAIEPQEICYRHLRRKYGKKIMLVRKGLGESKGFKKFHIADDSTISSFSDDWISAVKKTHRFKERSWNKAVLVEMTTLDELVKTYGKPTFIKIDVEGYELEVLHGLTQPVDMISFEYTVPEQPRRAIQCIEQIEKYNPHLECNYSIGEDLAWMLADWITIQEMKSLILTREFSDTCFGDIYIRTTS